MLTWFMYMRAVCVLTFFCCCAFIYIYIYMKAQQQTSKRTQCAYTWIMSTQLQRHSQSQTNTPSPRFLFLYPRRLVINSSSPLRIGRPGIWNQPWIIYDDKIYVKSCRRNKHLNVYIINRCYPRERQNCVQCAFLIDMMFVAYDIEACFT